MHRVDDNTDSLQKPPRTDPTAEHKGYNEHNPSQPEGAFHPESNKQSGISGKNKKERPVIPEKKLARTRK